MANYFQPLPVDHLSGLPREILLGIARNVITPVTTRCPISWGFPNIPDLDDSFRTAIRAGPRLFREVTTRDYLYIHMFCCGCAFDEPVHRLFSTLLYMFQRNRRNPDIDFYERSLRLQLSVLEIEIMCPQTRCNRSAKLKTFLATRDMMLTLYGILSQHLPHTHTLRIISRLNTQTSRLQAIEVLDEMREILFEKRISPDSILPAGYSLDLFINDVGQRLQIPKDQILLQEAHLVAIQQALDDGVALEQLVASLALYEWDTSRDNVFIPIRMWDIAAWWPARRYLFEFEVTYNCAVLQGLASYLLSRKLTHDEQFHFLMARSHFWLAQLAGVLEEVDVSIRCYWEFEEDNPNNIPVTIGWMAPIFKARVELLLAWARLNTLAKYVVPKYTPNQGVLDLDYPPVDDVEYLGDNEDEEFEFSTWGTPKSMLIVARKDMDRLQKWIDDAVNGEETNPVEGVHPMDIQANQIWMVQMVDIAAAIDDAQSKVGYDPTLGRRLLQDEMIEPEGLVRKLMYLPDAADRNRLHDLFESQGWQTD